MWIQSNNSTDTTEHVLACLSSSPSNPKIIRTAAQMAAAFGGTFTALYVETPSAARMTKENRERLQQHIRLAEELGAEITTVYGEDIPQQITEFARISKVTKIVLGRSNAAGNKLFRKPSLTDKVIRSAPGLDVHIIPDFEINRRFYLKKPVSGADCPGKREILISLAILAASTILGFLFQELSFTGADTITVYILGALLTALFTKNYICSAAFSFLSVFLFNLFFTEPRFSLHTYGAGYPVTFAIMLTASLITGILANKLSMGAKLSAHAAYRTDIMLETNQLLQKAGDEQNVIRILADQSRRLLSRNMIIYPVSRGKLEPGLLFPLDTESTGGLLFTESERVAAQWVLEHRKRAGAGTGRMQEAHCLYLAVRTDGEVFCVVGIQIGSKSLEPFENSILLSLLGECALAIENIRNAKEKEKNALLAKNEQLRADLLRSISHDLRTPLTSISGNTENLLINDLQIDPETRKQLLTDVYNDAQWLITLVENLLAVTRLSEGRLQIHMSAQLMDEVISEVLRHVGRKGADHHITAEFGDDLLLARMDARLISQVILNLIDNAIKYTPAGSDIRVSAVKQNDQIIVCVADNGPGIPDAHKDDVFKMFYTGENHVADCRRSLGLGLSLCRSILLVHNSNLILTDNEPHGCRFTFTLKSSEVTLNE